MNEFFMVSDHTLKKIGGDSFLFFLFFRVPSRAGNRYDSLATPLGTLRVSPILCHMLSSIEICVLIYLCVSLRHYNAQIL